MSRPKQTGGSPRLFTLGWPHLVVVALGVLVLLVLLGIMIYPSLYIEYIEETGIRQFESQYSFRTGDVTVPAYGSQPARVQWGIVSVAPDGAFGRLGIRAGDIPFEYHGGTSAMYGALQAAASGRASTFQVFSAADAPKGRAALRMVNLSAAKPRH